jgi:hypothetical protein
MGGDRVFKVWGCHSGLAVIKKKRSEEEIGRIMQGNLILEIYHEEKILILDLGVGVVLVSSR